MFINQLEFKCCRYSDWLIKINYWLSQCVVLGLSFPYVSRYLRFVQCTNPYSYYYSKPNILPYSISDVWGPFLIISPASTLHNWQQEMERFVPDFKVVPYWGSPQERKILRQFWDMKNLHTKDASFHVVITSYQLVVSDFKYFNRIKWQYLILDEAQAIKSSSRLVLFK